MNKTRFSPALAGLALISAGICNAQGVLSYSKDGTNVQLYGNLDYYLSYLKSSSGSWLIALRARLAGGGRSRR